jgi:hypothetical protein
MFAKFFDTTAVDAFAAKVAAELRKSFPPEKVNDSSKQAEKRREQLDQRIRLAVQNLARSTPLNIYQKAKLGTKLQAVLEGMGSPGEFSASLARDVVKLMALGPSNPR